MKKVLLFFVILLFLGTLQTKAQQQEWAIGLRFGDPAGLNIKKYLSNGNALDFNIGSSGYFYGGKNRIYRDGYRSAGIALMGNYVWHKELSGEALQWYYGFGGLISSRRYYRDYTKNGIKYNDNTNSFSLGGTAVIGLEYFIPDTPISIFGDAGLYIELIPAPFWLSVPLGLGGRFNF